ncbi:hypothetical protein KI688_010421 [Linnemannia hyalina]|uniref:Uncharacterized protein n=1 Tax=Linnemannia hyalina TaxID=64524 RepID=A0A9P8BVR5_9FUNG|nr:hypothetical protein KI688_010421 [Linnemannia hyalina]
MVRKQDQDQHDDKAALSPQLLPTPLLPYYSFVTTVSFEDTSHTTGCLLGNSLPTKESAVQDFMERTGRAARALAQEPFHRFRRGDVEKAIVSEVTELQLRQDLTWALCFSNAECIQTLYISIADIDRYMTLMPRLKVLSEVNFQLDRNTTMELQPEHEYTPEERTLSARLEEERTRRLEEMILFVKEHQRHHPKSIKTARCLSDRAKRDSCPDEYCFRLLQSLPPLNQPRCLDRNNWAQFTANVADTDLSCVKSIQYEMSGREVRFLSHLLEQRPFLQRCRSLEKLSVASFGEDMFKWAVQERKDFDERTAATSFHPDTFKSTRNLCSLDLRLEFHDTYSFIPHLKQFDQTSANNSGESADKHDDDDDDDDDNDNSFSTPSPQRRQPIWTWDWDLPNLTYLCLTSELA